MPNTDQLIANLTSDKYGSSPYFECHQNTKKYSSVNTGGAPLRIHERITHF